MNSGDITYEIIGCAMQVHTTLGPGLPEKPYENALAIELRERGIGCAQQPSYPIVYRDEVVGNYVPDIMVQESVLVDVRSVDGIDPTEVGQVLNYLRITGVGLGLVLNFKPVKLEIKRVSL